MEPNATVKLRIVVAEDCVDIADILAIIVAELGHTVAVAHDGFAAVRVAVDFQPDVILLDIGLPGLDGYETARRIREQLGTAVVLVALTAWTRSEDKELARLAGFEHHLAKPPDSAALERMLTALANQKQNRQPSERDAASLAATSLRGS